MSLRAVTLLGLSLLLHLSYPHPLSRPDSGLNKCRSAAQPLPALDVLPGGGWDNLRNVDMGRVMNFTFSLCHTTEDFLIPDEVFVIPQKVTRVETNSEIISSWLDQKGSTSSSINADISFLSVLNARFSTENERMKTHQVRDNSVTTRVQVRNFLYTVKANPDFTLDSRFARQAEEIADAIENNQTRHASYLSERMVLDFGTHVITSVDAGASLVEEDYLRSSYVSDGKTDKSSITTSAGLNFFYKVNITFPFDLKNAHDKPDLLDYTDHITYSIVQSNGGVPFYPGISLQKWLESTSNNMVAIDRSGPPLHYFINHNTFPDLPRPTVDKLVLSVSQAIKKYYDINTSPGCVKADSQNFNFQANVDDGSCDGSATNISFGGVFQQCTKLTPDADPICQAWDQKNPDTGDYSCRPPYQPTLLRSEVRDERYSQYVCNHCGFLGLQRCCGDEYHVRSARIQTYWCSSNENISENSGYLFGGLYGPSLQNPLTKSKSCPPNFIPLKMLSDDLRICVSNDYETGSRFAVPFGGLFSCKSTNPLAGDQPRCPPQFSQHLATVSDGCQILYCVQSGLFTGRKLLPVRLPPFTRRPLVSMTANNTVTVMTEGGRVWIRVGQTKMWKMVKPEEVPEMVRTFSQESDQLSGGQKFGVAFGAIVLVVVVVLGVVSVWRRVRGLPRLMWTRGHEEFFNEVQSERGEDSAGELQTSTNQV